MAEQKRILVVDDSETSLYLVRAVFQENPDIEIIIEKDSRQTIGLLKKEFPDLLLLDIMMPWIDGFELLDKIKSDEEIAHIPIIMISAKQDPELVDKAMQQNASGYIKKPIVVEEIRSKVNTILELEKN